MGLAKIRLMTWLGDKGGAIVVWDHVVGKSLALWMMNVGVAHDPSFRIDDKTVFIDQPLT